MLGPIVGALLLAGCAGFTPGGADRSGGWFEAPSAADQGARGVADLLAYATSLQGLPAQDLQARWQAEYHRVSERLRRHPDKVERLRLALLLTLPGTPEDDARARQLLEGYLDDAPAPPTALGNFARFLLHAVEEHSAQAARVRAAEQRSTALQSKINELLNIEQSIDRRPKPSVPEGK